MTYKQLTDQYGSTAKLYQGDCLELMKDIPDHSIDMTIEEVSRLYQVERWTLRRIATKFSSNHHRVKRMLIAAGIKITNEGRFREEFTKEHKDKIGAASRGRKPLNKGIRANEQTIRKYIKSRMRTQIDLNVYPDLNKLQLLIRITSKHFKQLGVTDTIRKAFLDKFYFNEQFNIIYDKWQLSGKNKWFSPSLDHKISKFNGGGWELENLQFLTWFENRTKAEMNQDEWDRFKMNTNTKSDMFI